MDEMKAIEELARRGRNVPSPKTAVRDRVLTTIRSKRAVVVPWPLRAFAAAAAAAALILLSVGLYSYWSAGADPMAALFPSTEVASLW